MWVGSIRLGVATKDVADAGTDDTVKATIVRDGTELMNLVLDFDGVDDHERGDFRTYSFVHLPRRNDKTPELPPGIGQNPMPYPDYGVEFSNGLSGHGKLRLRVFGDDLWVKDLVTISIREVKQVATSFDTLDWQDQPWQSLGTWGQDVPISGQWFPVEGYWQWDLNL